MNSQSQNWLFAAVIFAPLMAIGARVVYVVAKMMWRESVGDNLTALMRKSCVEGLALGVYGLVVALFLQQRVGRDIMITYLWLATTIMGIIAGGWAGRRWMWAWRTAGFMAVIFAGLMASIVG